MYTTLLVLHSILRWLVILLGVLAVVRAFIRAGGWTTAHDAAGKWYGISLDIQVLIGLLLYGFFSPVVRAAFADPGAAMGDTVLRFFFLEHILSMVIALALAHVGRARIRRATTDAAKFKAAAIFYTFSLLFVLIAIPWPFLRVARPLFPSL
jgi:hypothetical protein